MQLHTKQSCGVFSVCDCIQHIFRMFCAQLHNKSMLCICACNCTQRSCFVISCLLSVSAWGPGHSRTPGLEISTGDGDCWMKLTDYKAWFVCAIAHNWFKAWICVCGHTHQVINYKACGFPCNCTRKWCVAFVVRNCIHKHYCVGFPCNCIQTEPALYVRAHCCTHKLCFVIICLVSVSALGSGRSRTPGLEISIGDVARFRKITWLQSVILFVQWHTSNTKHSCAIAYTTLSIAKHACLCAPADEKRALHVLCAIAYNNRCCMLYMQMYAKNHAWYSCMQLHTQIMPCNQFSFECERFGRRPLPNSWLRNQYRHWCLLQKLINHKAWCWRASAHDNYNTWNCVRAIARNNHWLQTMIYVCNYTHTHHALHSACAQFHITYHVLYLRARLRAQHHALYLCLQVHTQFTLCN